MRAGGCLEMFDFYFCLGLHGKRVQSLVDDENDACAHCALIV